MASTLDVIYYLEPQIAAPLLSPMRTRACARTHTQKDEVLTELETMWMNHAPHNVI